MKHALEKNNWDISLLSMYELKVLHLKHLDIFNNFYMLNDVYTNCLIWLIAKLIYGEQIVLMS